VSVQVVCGPVRTRYSADLVRSGGPQTGGQCFTLKKVPSSHFGQVDFSSGQVTFLAHLPNTI